MSWQSLGINPNICFVQRDGIPADFLSIKHKRHVTQWLSIILLNHNIPIIMPGASFVSQMLMAYSCWHSDESHYQHSFPWSSFQTVIASLILYLDFGNGINNTFSLFTIITERGANGQVPSSCLPVKAFITKCR